MASAGASGHGTRTPSCNRLLQKKWDDRKFKEHKDRLRNIKPSIDNGAPRNFVHIKQNIRKHRLEEERQHTIDRHNNELITRMHHIMSTTGRVDHRNTDWRPKKSLNYIKRSNELERITKENHDFLKRLQSVKPQYSVRAMDSDYVQHRARTKSLSLFPQIQSHGKHDTSSKRPVMSSDRVVLPPIVEDISNTSRPDTHESEIKEEIEVDVED